MTRASAGWSHDLTAVSGLIFNVDYLSTNAIGEGTRATVTKVGDAYTVNIIWNDERWTADGTEPDFSVEAEI